MERRNDDLLLMKDVCQRVRLSRVTIWRMSTDGSFPKPDYKLGKSRIAWNRETIEAWLNSQRSEVKAAM